MPEAAMRLDIGNRFSVRAGGWLVSLVVHGGAMALAMLAAIDIKPSLQPEKFQWDIVLQQAPAPSPAIPEEVRPQEKVTPALPPPRPQKVQPSAQPPTPRTIERTAVVQTVSAVKPVQQVVERASTQERQAVTTKVHSRDTQVIHAEAIASAVDPVQQDIHEVGQEAEQPIPAAMPREVVSQQKAAVVEAHATAVEQPSTIEAQSAVVEQPAVIEAQSAAVEQPALSHAQPAAIEQTLVQQAGTAAPQTETTIVSTAAVEHRAVQALPQARADFGWLSESLWARIEQLKRYPTQARSRRWEGKVVIEAVIREDGTILHCQVAESSGHGILDQDAISVLRRASPLSLKHPLGQAQITILVPIAYRLHS